MPLSSYRYICCSHNQGQGTVQPQGPQQHMLQLQQQQAVKLQVVFRCNFLTLPDAQIVLLPQEPMC